jgi:hypothetical protein
MTSARNHCRHWLSRYLCPRFEAAGPGASWTNGNRRADTIGPSFGRQFLEVGRPGIAASMTHAPEWSHIMSVAFTNNRGFVGG